MKKESITKLDLNFSNAGGGHTASVTTMIGGKTLGGDDGLGTVLGRVGEINEFSNAQIDSAMARFVCTQVTTSAGPTKKTQTRRYSDRTSLLLDSLIVLVRGIGCGPEGGEVERSIAYYSEVINTPLQPFKSMGPQRKGSVIEVGRIYNQEAAAAYSGIKMGLVYNNRELKKPLCLNLDFVSDTYEANPDLSQFELKFGYTLNDFRQMLGLAGVAISGLPEKENESVLFETSGTLSSVVSSVASYLGYFWYIDPLTGVIELIDTQTASALTVTDYTETLDPNITNASFTESIVTNKIVNTYSGTTERKEPQSNSADSAIRSRKAFFKNVKLESIPQFQKIINKEELGTFFALFNQGVSTDTFDKFAYIVTILAKKEGVAPVIPRSALQKRFGKKWANFDIKNLYKDSDGGIEPHDMSMYSFIGFAESDAETTYSIFCSTSAIAPKVAKLTKLRVFPDRIENKYIYYRLADSSYKKMPRPSSTDLYTFLKAYFEIGGGVFVSNGYGTYKADRMQFTNTNTVTICGPYEGKEFIHRIPELSALSDIFDILKINPQTVKKLAEHTNGKAQTVNDNFFIALKSIPKLERPPIKKVGKNIETVDFIPFVESTELLEGIQHKPNQLYIGGPKKIWQNINRLVFDMIDQSSRNYNEAIERKNVLSVKYQRSKTKVNRLSEDGEEAEDDDIANSSEDDQKESDLFDRFDTRYWGIEQPYYSLLNKLSLSGASGTTVEMKALRSIRGTYRDGSYRPSSSSRTLYGLSIPQFTPTLNSVSLSVGSNGIITTVNESTIKLIPPDQSFLQTRGMEALSPKSTLPKVFSAAQRNVLGL